MSRVHRYVSTCTWCTDGHDTIHALEEHMKEDGWSTLGVIYVKFFKTRVIHVGEI